MGWNLTWLPMGAAAFILVLVNLSRAGLKKHQGWQILLFASLSCGVLAVLAVLRVVPEWLQEGKWGTIEDVIPALAKISSIAAGLGIVLNLLALCLHLQAEKEENTDGKS